MDLIKHTANWANGDAFQGKLMLAVGVVTLISVILIVRGENPILKGMLIPLGLIVLIGLGYGGFLSFSRPGHLVEVQKMYQNNPQQVISQELVKAERDNKNYTMIKKIWPILIAIAALLLYFLHGDYARGILIGLLMVFVFGLILDTFLHQRLQPYLNVLQELNK
jgi:hypothetical protein